MSRPGSRLPADPAYWSALQERIVAAGADAIGAVERGPVWSVPRWAASLLAACAVLAVLGSWAFLPPPASGVQDDAEVAWVRALLPADPMAAPLLEDRPPSLAALIGGER